MRILITGVSGFVGAALAASFAGKGHELHGMARDPSRVTRDLRLAALHRGDAVTGSGLGAALAGVDVAYYLIHSMERSNAGTFSDRDRTAAELFGRSAAAAGVKRIVYLGGPASDSEHLTSRIEVERLLLEAVPDSVMFRASIVLAARSRSFRFIARLVERLPVLALPPWRNFRTQPIDGRDVIAYLQAAATVTDTAGHCFEIGGPQPMSYGALIDRVTELMLVRRPVVRLPVTLAALSGPLAAAITGEDIELVGPLMGGLNGDLLLDDVSAREIFGVRLHSVDSAIERSLRDLEALEGLRAR